MNDEMILKNLLSTINNYDIFDFIAKVSSLNLIPHNQNKSIIFDIIIDNVLRNCSNFSVARNKMSRRKFEDIVNNCMKLSLSAYIDPIEVPFVYRIIKKKIIITEVKDFSFTKSPYEIHQEYLKVFCDQNDKLCYISKHKRRVEWIKKHLQDIIKHYHLDSVNWKIDDLLIVNEDIVSNEYYHLKQKILLYTDISKDSINKI